MTSTIRETDSRWHQNEVSFQALRLPLLARNGSIIASRPVTMI
jgi:hypothetical protein